MTEKEIEIDRSPVHRPAPLSFEGDRTCWPSPSHHFCIDDLGLSALDEYQSQQTVTTLFPPRALFGWSHAVPGVPIRTVRG